MTEIADSGGYTFSSDDVCRVVGQRVRDARQSLARTRDAATRAHLQDIDARIVELFDVG